MNFEADRLSLVKPSASVVVSQTARNLKAEGKPVIDLGLGEPDFSTPLNIIEAAHQAALAGQTRYTPMTGTVALRNAVSEKFLRENKLQYAPEEIIVSNGAKQIIFSAMMATLEPGDEVLMCAPYFGCYRDIVLSLGGTPKAIPCTAETEFRLMPAALQAAITDKTRWLMLNLPSNPAGAFYSEQQLAELGEVLKEHPRIILMSDEIYEHIVFDGKEFVSCATAMPDLKDRTLTVNGVSKAYAMTGWRIGYGGGPKALIDAMSKVQSQISSAPCSVAQAAAVEALTGPQDEVHRFREAFEKRRDLVVKHVEQIPGLDLKAPGGAFYAYIGCVDLIGKSSESGMRLDSDIDVAAYLLTEANVALVPGSAYELSPYIRLSTATSEENLDTAMQRIAFAVSKLK